MDSSKTLFVLRHAKSDWGEEDLRDFDRPLKTRGIVDARNIAHSLRNELRSVEMVLSSPANRAIHTAILFCQTIGLPVDLIKIKDNLYETTEGEVDKIVKSLPEDICTAMVVSHNPTLTYFANMYFPYPIDNIPTSGIVKLEFGVNSWSKISRDNLVSSFFDFPKNH